MFFFYKKKTNQYNFLPMVKLHGILYILMLNIVEKRSTHMKNTRRKYDIIW